MHNDLGATLSGGIFRQLTGLSKIKYYVKSLNPFTIGNFFCPHGVAIALQRLIPVRTVANFPNFEPSLSDALQFAFKLLVVSFGPVKVRFACPLIIGCNIMFRLFQSCSGQFAD